MKGLITHPINGYMGAQIAFWSVINIFFTFFIGAFFQSLSTFVRLPVRLNFPLLTIFMFLMAIFHGAVLGAANYYIDRLFYVLQAFWRAVVTQIIVSVIVFVLSYGLVRYLLTDTFFSAIGPMNDITQGKGNQFLTILFFQYVAGSILSGFGVQMIRKFGRTTFIPVVLGRYRRPREEDRIFMFLDLKSSTSLAEKLGHIRYSAFLRQFILDVNHSLHRHHADIYQYVGDEVVLTWKRTPRHSINALNFYFACVKRIKRREQYYLENFGTVPVFKAGVDAGVVTAVEIGDMKRDIAYHGDTLNTAARIQAECNGAGLRILLSGSFIAGVDNAAGYTVLPLGGINLKGKGRAVEIYTVLEKT